MRFCSWLKHLEDVHGIDTSFVRKSTWLSWLNGESFPTDIQSKKLLERLPHGNHYRDMMFKILCEEQTPRKGHEKTIYIKPMASPRPRFTRNGRPYMPKTYMDWKKDFGFLVGPWGPFHGPISIQADFHFQSSSRTWGPHTSSQDVDNLLKSVMDALQDCEVIQDDKMVYSVIGRKWFSYEDKIILSIYT